MERNVWIVYYKDMQKPYRERDAVQTFISDSSQNDLIRFATDIYEKREIEKIVRVTESGKVNEYEIVFQNKLMLVYKDEVSRPIVKEG